jgi:hypothetical protein
MRELDQVLTGLGLDLTGWTLRQVTGLSADGQTIVGWGTNPNGDTEAWLASLSVAEPGTAGLVALGLLGLRAGLRRHARV